MTETTTTTPAADVDTFDYKGTGRQIAGYLYGAKNTFEACRRLHAASAAGASHESLAKEIATELTTLSAEKTSFSRQAVDQRVNAYGLVTELTTPTADLVAKAYTLAQKPSAATEFASIRDTFERSGEVKLDQATLLDAIKVAITRANADKKAKAQAKKAGDEPTETEVEEGKSTVEETFVTAAEVAAFITAQGTRTWSAEDRELILEAMANFAATTA